jgi:formylglycine-generating enzyme required for sulfatase activity
MTTLFISYRRTDSQHITDRIHDQMMALFGENNVFQDVENIPLGADFPDVLRAEIEKCDVILVIIGHQWGRLMHERRALPTDFVRLEIEIALALRAEQGKLVIPVMVDGAVMPDIALLPDSIVPLCRLNAARIRPNPDFKRDCQVLADGIGRVLAARAPLPRKEKSTTNLAQLSIEMTWCAIPAGHVTLIEAYEEYSYFGYKGQTLTASVAAFEIGRYPVTVAQYAAFIRDGGYTNVFWWNGLAERVHAPRELPEWSKPDHPRVNVSWYEAVAFCRWLSDKTDSTIRLPTEQEWQRAAQGDDGRAFPWGNIWDGMRCNNSVEPFDSNGTSAVSAYQGKGDSPFGVVDMAGNVWEWCLTAHETGQTDVVGDGRRVLRGGGWYFFEPTFFRTDNRYNDTPDLAASNVGFRVVREK